MKNEENKEGVKTKWSSEDEATLVFTLFEARSKGQWGDNNPKKPAWVACEAALTGSEKRSGGIHKDIPAIKSRWQRLKQEYDIVKHMRSQSGWGWNNKKNLPRVKDDVWEKYVKSRPKAKIWRTKPFPLYDEIADLVNGSRASGERSFRPGDMDAALEVDDINAGSTSIPIDPVLLAESTNQQKLYSDSDSDDDDDDTPKSSKEKVDEDKENKSEGDDSTDDEATNIKPPRKRTKSVTSTGNERRKVRRVSAAQGIQDVADTMSEMVGALNNMIKAEPSESSTSTAHRSPLDKRSMAIKAIQKDEYLSKDDFGELMVLLTLNHEVGNVYLTIDDPEARTCYLEKQLDHYRKHM